MYVYISRNVTKSKLCYFRCFIIILMSFSYFSFLYYVSIAFRIIFIGVTFCISVLCMPREANFSLKYLTKSQLIYLFDSCKFAKTGCKRRHHQHH